MNLLIIIKISGVIFLIIFLIFLVYLFLPKEKIYNTLLKWGWIIEERGPFWTSREHMEKLGIENIKLSPEEEKTLHSIIEKAIKAGFRYYDTGEDKDIEPIKNIFLPEEYEIVKEDIKRTRVNREVWEDENCKILIEIPETKFSQPRKYRDLENMIGIISDTDGPLPEFLGGGCGGSLYFIFVFKQVNGNWKIVKMWPVSIRLEWSEEVVIEKILREIKEGSKK